jgi:uncharacterized protein with PIN domain
LKLDDVPADQRKQLEEVVGPVVMRAVQEMQANAEKSICPSCHKDMGIVTRQDFKDQVSYDEFNITGYCQPCQDVIFAPPPDDDEMSYPLSLGD